MRAGLIAFLLALPRLIELAAKLGEWLSKNGEWLNEFEIAIDRLERASNKQQKLDAARAITDSIRDLK